MKTNWKMMTKSDNASVTKTPIKKAHHSQKWRQPQNENQFKNQNNHRNWGHEKNEDNLKMKTASKMKTTSRMKTYSKTRMTAIKDDVQNEDDLNYQASLKSKDN